MHVEKAIVFAEREGFRALELDVYRPSTPGEDPDRARPLLVYVHGVGWRVSHRSRPPRETREWSSGVFERLTGMGFVVAAPDYRLSGEALFPAQLDDTLEAVRWLHANADDLGVVRARTCGARRQAATWRRSRRSSPTRYQSPASCAGTRSPTCPRSTGTPPTATRPTCWVAPSVRTSTWPGPQVR